jgi:hypothetical protein
MLRVLISADPSGTCSRLTEDVRLVRLAIVPGSRHTRKLAVVRSNVRVADNTSTVVESLRAAERRNQNRHTHQVSVMQPSSGHEQTYSKNALVKSVDSSQRRSYASARRAMPRSHLRDVLVHRSELRNREVRAFGAIAAATPSTR